jgi:hypothetical protein
MLENLYVPSHMYLLVHFYWIYRKLRTRVPIEGSIATSMNGNQEKRTNCHFLTAHSGALQFLSPPNSIKPVP